MSHRGESASTMLTSNYGMHRRYICSKVVLVGLFDSILGFYLASSLTDAGSSNSMSSTTCKRRTWDTSAI